MQGAKDPLEDVDFESLYGSLDNVEGVPNAAVRLTRALLVVAGRKGKAGRLATALDVLEDPSVPAVRRLATQAFG